MKNLVSLACLSLAFGLMCFSCQKQQNEDMDSMSIIGVDPCTSYYTGYSGKGYVIRLDKTLDTVLTYNLPSSIQKQIEKLKPVGGTFFENKNILKVNLSYRFATDEEEVWPLCLANMLIEFLIEKQIIILPNPNPLE